MPAVSDKQAHTFQMALAIKKGKKINIKNPAISRIAKTLSESKIQEFTHKG